MREIFMGLVCLSPIILFLAGWYAHAFFARNRLRSPFARRDDISVDTEQPQQAGGLFHKAWEP